MFKIIKKINKLIVFIIIIFFIVSIGLVSLTTRYPIGYTSLIVKYSNQYDIDPYLIASIINIESKYDKDALSNKDARGLMQIGPQTGKWASEVLEIKDYNEDLLFDPETNIKIGTWYIRTLFKEFDENLDLVLAAYNAGSGNVKKWLNDEKYCSDGSNLYIIPFKETDDYLVKVKESYKIYSTLYKKQIMNPTNKDSFYINLLHNIRKNIKGLIRII